MTNSPRKRVLEDFNRRCKAAEYESQKSIAEWAFNEMKLTIMPSPSTISTLCKNRTNFEDKEPSFIPERKRKTERKYTEIENALLERVIFVLFSA